MLSASTTLQWASGSTFLLMPDPRGAVVPAPWLPWLPYKLPQPRASQSSRLLPGLYLVVGSEFLVGSECLLPCCWAEQAVADVRQICDFGTSMQTAFKRTKWHHIAMGKWQFVLMPDTRGVVVPAPWSPWLPYKLPTVSGWVDLILGYKS